MKITLNKLATIMKKYWYIFVVIIIIIIPYVLEKEIFGNKILTNLSNSERSNILGSYIGSIISGIGTLLAVIMSYKISENIQKKHEEKENSIIVYYDLLLSIKDYKKFYIVHF